MDAWGELNKQMLSPHRIRKLLGPLFLTAIALTTIAWGKKGDLADPSSVHTDLLREPDQATTTRPEFSFAYKGKSCLVRPVSTYDLYGLVVSHNNINSVADIYHDSTSVDTKDLCVIWGSNLETTEFHEVEFKSGPWTCYFSYPHGTNFGHNELGNNHLITDSSIMRKKIDEVRIGDQIHLRGLLVDYQMSDWRTFWRKSSTTRKDNGCEVVFVEELEILQAGTPGWYLAYRFGWLTLVLIPVAFLATMWFEAGDPEKSQLGRL
jgi:hypothetical protein